MKKLLVVVALVGCNSSPATGDAKTALPASGDTFDTGGGTLAVTPIHHATFLLRVAGKAIYFDPVSDGASYDGLTELH